MTPLETRAAEIFEAGWPKRRIAAIASATSKITGECREDNRLNALRALAMMDRVAAAAQADREHKAVTARRIVQNRYALDQAAVDRAVAMQPGAFVRRAA